MRKNPLPQSKPAAWKIALLTVVGMPIAFITFGSLAQHAFDWYQDHRPESRTRFAMSDLGYLICIYPESHKAMPPTTDNRLLASLLQKEPPTPLEKYDSIDLRSYLNANGEIVDGWGTPLRIEFSGFDDFKITSAGPDRIFGTSDDITDEGATDLVEESQVKGQPAR
jgi:hypothetical protein